MEQNGSVLEVYHTMRVIFKSHGQIKLNHRDKRIKKCLEKTRIQNCIKKFRPIIYSYLERRNRQLEKNLKSTLRYPNYDFNFDHFKMIMNFKLQKKATVKIRWRYKIILS
ncbi:hypothetical protein BpHYR1_009403 [Brachionus plicatilis]|uniref:Uncharacterized protein n=1 Tax=Brachionus plicatilis TaxID=10195 RepID=A0A3M7RLW8_BRAPC|nr:hypothetical protein BpHYR1_009403 [Brachionus plicatilis]